MRGHIVKRGKDSYSLVLNLGRDPATGKRKQQWVSVKGTKKEAEKRLADLLHQLDTGTFMKPGKTTLAEFAARWLQEYAQPNLAPKTTDGYESIIRCHLVPALGSTVLTQVRPEHLQKLYAAKLADGVSHRTVRYIHATAHIILHTAQRWGMVSRNVADSVTPPKQQRSEMHILDDEGLQRVLEAASATQYYSLFYVLLFTGMRRSEALALRWNDVDLLMGQVSVSRTLYQHKDRTFSFRAPKTAKGRRMIALPPSVCVVLREHRQQYEARTRQMGLPVNDDSLIFCHLDGSPMLPHSVSQAWAKLADRVGYPEVRLHDCRHTHASVLLRQGVHPKVVQERLGHANIGITLDTYSHVAPGMQEAAARAFDELAAPKREKGAVGKIG